MKIMIMDCSKNDEYKVGDRFEGVKEDRRYFYIKKKGKTIKIPKGDAAVIEK